MSKKIYREKLNRSAREAHIEYYGEHLSRNEREAFDNAVFVPTASNPLATSADIAAIPTGGNIEQEDAYSIVVYNESQHTESVWENYSLLHNAYIDGDNYAKIEMSPAYYSLDTRGIGGVVQIEASGNSLEGGGEWNLTVYDPDFINSLNLAVTLNGVIVNNYEVDLITDDKSLTTKEFVEGIINGAGTPVNAVAASGILTFDDVATDGEVVVIGDDTYEFDSDSDYTVGNIQVDIAVVDVPAEGTLTVTAGGNQIAEGDTVTIDGTTYTFTVGDGKIGWDYEFMSVGDVRIQTDDETTLGNLYDSLNNVSDWGDNFKNAGEHSTVQATASDATTLDVAARTGGVGGNSISVSETGAELSWDGTELSGGAPGDPVTVQDCIEAFVAAVTTSATEDVTAADGAGDTVDVVANTAGAAGNLTTTTDGAELDWGGDTLLGGVDGTAGAAGKILVDAGFLYIATADNTIADANWKKVALSAL